MHRTRDWRRAHNQRVINNRLDIVKNAYRDDAYYEYLKRKSHSLSKHNLVCGCALCQMNKTKRDDDFSLERELEAYDNYMPLHEEQDEWFLREIGVID